MKHTASGSNPPKVLVVDDEEGIRDLCTSIVSSAGLEAHTARDGLEGFELVSRLRPEYVLLDANLPGRHGMELLKEIRVRFPATRVVMITGYATVDRAVEAMKLGAYDYIPKPFTARRLLDVIAKQGQAEAPKPEGEPPRRSFCNLVGASSAMQHIYGLIEKAARSDSTVLIEGESGTGKELVARGIHARSARRNERFLPVDCGAIAATLVESELFGHEAGAYTDAKTATRGLLRSAGGGTAFLDEIGELHQSVQVKLLRALQEMEVRPVGGPYAIPFQARIITATNSDLTQAMARGRFRRDLFYRLHVIPIFLPPLRERREDIPLLVQHFLTVLGKRHGREMGIAVEALRHFTQREWPGNVRELENIIQRAFALLDGETIRLSDMALLFPRQAAPPGESDGRSHLLAAQEAQTIARALKEANGNKREAARMLGIGIATLYRKIKKHAIEV